MRNEASLAKISAWQQSKLAYIYLRQSSMGQVRNNQESTVLQYQLTAGEYVYGRRITDPARSNVGQRGSILLPMNKWLVCLQGVYPAYITWEEYLANQEQLSDNINLYEKDKPGAVRKGSVLLQGIAFCG